MATLRLSGAKKRGCETTEQGCDAQPGGEGGGGGNGGVIKTKGRSYDTNWNNIARAELRDL
jgi:hypothetical protein